MNTYRVSFVAHPAQGVDLQTVVAEVAEAVDEVTILESVGVDGSGAVFARFQGLNPAEATNTARKALRAAGRVATTDSGVVRQVSPASVWSARVTGWGEVPADTAPKPDPYADGFSLDYFDVADGPDGETLTEFYRRH